MDLKLKNRAVLVTGAGRNVGREIGLAFAREGAHVVFHYRTAGEGAGEAAAAARQLGVKSAAVAADIRDPQDVAALVLAAEAAVGPLDVLVNNAFMSPTARFLDHDPAQWEPVIATNVLGTLLVTQAVLKGMVARRYGKIITLMGDAGRVGDRGLVLTGTTKASVLGLTKSVAKEFGPLGINANAVSLGLVKTPTMDHVPRLTPEQLEKLLQRYPLRRLGEMADVPPMVLFLASDLASWITGQVISVSGGYSTAG